MEPPALMKAGKDEALVGSGGMLSLNGRHFVTEGPNGPNTAQMAGSTAVVEVALRNRFKDGEGARVLGRASAGQWLYLARTAASEINMGIAPCP